MPKFSIILPVHNGGSYFKECVNSILSQTFPDFNLIILDNNSTDGTSEWLQQHTDPRIIIHHSSVSLSMTENWARIKDVPKNEFMTIIGHDDILLPNYLEIMNALIEQHPNAGLYQTHFNYIDADGKIIRPCQPMDEKQGAGDFLKCHIYQTLDSMGTGYLFRSADYDRLGGIPTNFPNLMFADYALWIQLIGLSYKATSSNTCFEYRIHNSTSKQTNGDLYCEAFEKYVAFLVEFSMLNNEVQATVQKHGHQLLMYYCESLSHRLLKTPIQNRKRTVSSYINMCKEMAKNLIPGQSFHPLNNWKIFAALLFDSNAITRKLFYLVKGKH